MVTKNQLFDGQNPIVFKSRRRPQNDPSNSKNALRLINRQTYHFLKVDLRIEVIIVSIDHGRITIEGREHDQRIGTHFTATILD